MTSDQGSRKRTRCLAYIAAGIIAQTVIIVLLVVLVLRVKTPKVRIESVSVSTLTTNSTSSFKGSITALVTVKNKNFGHYKFDASKAIFSYKGTEVGEGSIVKDKAKAKKTKKLNVTVALDSNKVSSTSQLKSDLSAGSVMLTASAKLDGKVHLLNILKKKKSANLNCTIHLDTKAKTAHIESCK